MYSKNILFSPLSLLYEMFTDTVLMLHYIIYIMLSVSQAVTHNCCADCDVFS